LFLNAFPCLGINLFIRVAGNGHFPFLLQMSVLTMAALLIFEILSVVHQSPNGIAHLHSLFPIRMGVKHLFILAARAMPGIAPLCLIDR